MTSYNFNMTCCITKLKGFSYSNSVIILFKTILSISLLEVNKLAYFGLRCCTIYRL